MEALNKYRQRTTHILVTLFVLLGCLFGTPSFADDLNIKLGMVEGVSKGIGENTFTPNDPRFEEVMVVFLDSLIELKSIEHQKKNELGARVDESIKAGIAALRRLLAKNDANATIIILEKLMDQPHSWGDAFMGQVLNTLQVYEKGSFLHDRAIKLGDQFIGKHAAKYPNLFSSRSPHSMLPDYDALRTALRSCRSAVVQVAP